MTQPLVSVVVLSYNYGRFLKECLDSVLAQQAGFPFEVIVVDDASLDDSQAILRSYSDPRVRIILHEKNRGHAATVTDGLNAACGKYVSRIDCDDRYRPGFLEAAVSVLEKFPEVGLVYGDAAIIDEQGRRTCERTDPRHGGKPFKGNELVPLLEKNFVCSPTVMARKEAWLRTLPVPPDLSFHDWFFTLLIARDWDFYYLPEVLADYRVHPANLHTAIIRNKTEEPSILYMLGRVFGTPEKSPELERAKQAARSRVYAAHYLLLGNKYFGYRLVPEAARCYRRALRYKPALILDPGLLRRLFGATIGLEPYDWIKRSVKKAFK